MPAVKKKAAALKRPPGKVTSEKPADEPKKRNQWGQFTDRPDAKKPGRPKGSKNVFTIRFVRAIEDMFDESNGGISLEDSLRSFMDNYPVEFWKIVARIFVPKDINLSLDASTTLVDAIIQHRRKQNGHGHGDDDDGDGDNGTD